MPLDAIILTGDKLRVTQPVSGANIPQAASPQPLVGTSASVKVMKKAVCLLGDELPPSLRVPLTYTMGSYTIPGTGTLQVILSPPNISKQTKNGKSLLLKGTQFSVKFQVVSPAQMPPPPGVPGPPTPDMVWVKMGSASFITTNQKVKAQ